MIPAAVIAGNRRAIRSTGTGEELCTVCASRVQVEMVRDALRIAKAEFSRPNNPSAAPQTPSTKGTPPSGSSMARGSSSKKEGTVNAAVITAAVTSGNMRQANSKSATRRTGCLLAYSHTLRQLKVTASDRAQYTIKNTENETARPR